eukprot:gene8188-25880_t
MLQATTIPITTTTAIATTPASGCPAGTNLVTEYPPVQKCNWFYGDGGCWSEGCDCEGPSQVCSSSYYAESNAKQPQSSSGGGGCSVEQADPPDCDLFAEEACGTILEVYLQPNALQPAWYDSQPGRRSTISATEAGIVYAIPLDLQDDAGSGSTADTNGYAMPLANYAVVGTNSSTTTTTNGIVYAIPVDLQDDAGSGSTADTNSYAMPLANYAVVGTGSSATTNGGGGGGGNHEYAIPEARSKAAPLLPLDLDGYVVDDTVPAGAGAAPGGVVYGSSNENAARLATNSTYA